MKSRILQEHGVYTYCRLIYHTIILDTKVDCLNTSVMDKTHTLNEESLPGNTTTPHAQLTHDVCVNACLPSLIQMNPDPSMHVYVPHYHTVGYISGNSSVQISC